MNPSNIPPKENIAYVYRVIRHGLIAKQSKTLIFENVNLDVIRARQHELKRNGVETITVAIVEDVPQFGAGPTGNVPPNAEPLSARLVY